jgi:hypothetical protein
LPFSTTFHQESSMYSMLLMEDQSDDDNSCDIYSNSTYLWAPFGVLRHVASRLIAAFGAWMHAETTRLAHPFGVVTVCSDSSYRSICRSKTYSADSLCTSTVSTDTFSDSSSSSIWSITSLEGDWDFDTQRYFVLIVGSKEEELDGTNNICVSLIKLSHHIIQIPNKNERIFSNKLISVWN